MEKAEHFRVERKKFRKKKVEKMTKKEWERNRKLELLQCLLEEPRVTYTKLAEKINTYPRMVRERKKELEADHTYLGVYHCY